MDKPKKLGRGLSSLLSVHTPVQVVHVETSVVNEHTGPSTHQTDGLVHIPIADIIPNRFQPRRHIDEATIAQLAASIKTSGVMQPIVVRPLTQSVSGGVVGGHGSAAGATWELVAGERRWRAASEAGLRTVPAVIRELSDSDSAQWAIVENVQREDLNPIDKALAFRALGEQFGMTQSEIAERVGVDRSTIANLIRLTELEPVLQDLVARGDLSNGHAKILLSLESEPELSQDQRGRVILGKRAAASGWSVKTTEIEVKKWQSAIRTRKLGGVGQELAAAHQNAATDKTLIILADLARQIGEVLGTKVEIQPRVGRKGMTAGRIMIEYYDIDHFDGLVEKFRKCT